MFCNVSYPIKVRYSDFSSEKVSGYEHVCLLKTSYCVVNTWTQHLEIFKPVNCCGEDYEMKMNCHRCKLECHCCKEIIECDENSFYTRTGSKNHFADKCRYHISVCPKIKELKQYRNILNDLEERLFPNYTEYSKILLKLKENREKLKTIYK